MTRRFDCMVCGSCVVDILCRPVDLSKPIGGGKLYQTDPAVLTGGGITLNAGAVMARLGLEVGVFSYVGQDPWAQVIRNLLARESIDDANLMTHPTHATSTTMVVIDPTGERSFFHCVGAPKLLDAKTMLARMDVFADSRFMLLGYYSLLPNLENDLPEVLEAIRQRGCKTALDAAGSGGAMQPLERILPQLDVYVPSLAEAEHQTGERDPQTIIKRYRACNAPGLLGVKLGRQGIMLSPARDEYVHIPIVDPPGEVVDTTGAGDSFYAGLLAGLIKGLPLFDAGRLGAAAAACCVTAIGGSGGARDWQQTNDLIHH